MQPSNPLLFKGYTNHSQAVAEAAVTPLQGVFGMIDGMMESSLITFLSIFGRNILKPAVFENPYSHAPLILL